MKEYNNTQMRNHVCLSSSTGVVKKIKFHKNKHQHTLEIYDLYLNLLDMRPWIHFDTSRMIHLSIVGPDFSASELHGIG